MENKRLKRSKSRIQNREKGKEENNTKIGCQR